MHNGYTKFTVPRGPDTGTWKPAPGLGERWQQGQSHSYFKDTTGLHSPFCLFPCPFPTTSSWSPAPMNPVFYQQTPGSLTALAHIASNLGNRRQSVLFWMRENKPRDPKWGQPLSDRLERVWGGLFL